MIEVAAVLSAVVQKWDDFVIITIMLLVNAGLDFFQEHRTLNALKALKQRLKALCGDLNNRPDCSDGDVFWLTIMRQHVQLGATVRRQILISISRHFA